MDVNIVARAPEAHCYRCGGKEIAAICHHCGRPMCHDHIGRYSRWVEWLLRGPLLRLRLSPHEGQPAMHCQRCRHRLQVELTTAALGVVFAGLVAAGVLALNGFWQASFAGLLLCAILFSIVRLVPRRQVNFETLHWGRITPVFPRVDKLAVTEHFHEVRAHLDEAGRYRLLVEPAQGTLIGKFSLDPPKLTKWQRLVRRLRPKTAITTHFSAGFLVLKGQIAVKSAVATPANLVVLPTPIIPLIGERSVGQSGHAETDLPAGDWSITQTYRYLNRLDKRQFPVRLVPSLRPDAERHTLELCFQFIQPGSPFAPIFPQQIRLLKVIVPATWGEVEYSSGGAQVSLTTAQDTGEAIRILKWERVSIGKRHVDQGWRVLQVRFAEEIKQDVQIEAFAEVVFSGSLSGIENARLFSPLGVASDLTDPMVVETIVQLDFVGQLESLRYQRVRTVPGPNRAEGSLEYEPFLVFPGVAPTADAIVTLTNRLSESDFYIQWIVENPPHTGERAYVTNHYWDIGGRHYQGICPVDFHLVVTGQEVHSAGVAGKARDGTVEAKREAKAETVPETKVVLSAQGVYSVDTAALEIDRVYKELVELTKEALGPRPEPDEDELSSGEPT